MFGPVFKSWLDFCMLLVKLPPPDDDEIIIIHSQLAEHQSGEREIERDKMGYISRAVVTRW